MSTTTPSTSVKLAACSHIIITNPEEGDQYMAYMPVWKVKPVWAPGDEPNEDQMTKLAELADDISRSYWRSNWDNAWSNRDAPTNMSFATIEAFEQQHDQLVSDTNDKLTAACDLAERDEGRRNATVIYPDFATYSNRYPVTDHGNALVLNQPDMTADLEAMWSRHFSRYITSYR
ncbi:hypothetical protein L202_07197 [Cryptococcus amylolentus CBS 6039]|uniref:Uncharacterized protein n=2 Tax=Cryptococcus amylolentus TaxID=104669 RepID=A0A1E3HF05_9TREE|nr:hypothetical protein L202_07197 [Cryptococcus amylolentus CBS 6039]ODN74894.1 hypothetical protein L202_07197 [Cryptococcus amylolentus CBS 6039]ODO01787.1 hypothetical protein I350_06617 [Cryptococcus amylolentus CBS 6273]